jgi:hypothetical protein
MPQRAWKEELPSPLVGKKRARPAESGDWDSRTSATENKLPKYDAAADPHCPYTHTKKFKSLNAKIKKYEELDKKKSEDKKGASQPVALSQSTVKDKGATLSVEPKKKDNGLHSKRQLTTVPSLVKGGVTWQMDGASDPTSELEVLKCIILREGYIAKLKGMVKSKDALRNDLVDNIDLIRLITVEVIESIKRWRENLPKPYPFIWNGINYLLKIPSDMDFLDKTYPLKTWFGFSLTRNPFMIPIALDNRLSTPRYQYQKEAAKRGRTESNPLPEYEDMGGKDKGSKCRSGSENPTNEVGPKKGGDKHEKGPYEVPVVNDPDLMKSITNGFAIKANASKSSDPSPMTGQSFVNPSQVSELDMLRIRG